MTTDTAANVQGVEPVALTEGRNAVRILRAWLAESPRRPFDHLALVQELCGGFVYTAASLSAITADRDRLREALTRIAAIPNQQFGPDWEEIEEARAIALSALESQ